MAQTPPFKADVVGSLLRPQAFARRAHERAKGEITPRRCAASRARRSRRRWRCSRRSGSKSAPTASSTAATGRWISSSASTACNYRAPSRSSSTTRQGDIEFAPPRLEVHGKLAPHAALAVTISPSSSPSPTAHGPRRRSSRSRRRPSCISAAAAPRSSHKPIPTWTSSSPISPGLSRGDHGALRRRLPLSADRRDQSAVPLRPQAARSRAQHRRGPGQAAGAMCGSSTTCVRDRPKDMVVCMHMCRGNHMSAWVAEGGYDPVAEVVFGELDDRRLLSRIRFAPRRQLRAAALSHRQQGRGARPRHHQEARARSQGRVEAAHRRGGEDRAARAPGLSAAMRLRQHHPGQCVTVEDEKRKLRLVVETAKEVWGTA